MRPLAADEEIERALRYLVDSFESSGDNPKPVILHSTRVGMDLYDRGYERDVVVAGFLHDLLEDTDVTADEIRSRFGDDVADVVAAASFDEDIDDYLERHRDIYRRCFELGRDAVLVKAADLLDNSDYYGTGDDDELLANLVEKMEHFIEESEPHIGDEDLHAELAEKLPVVKERVGLDR
jgi:(p)ppGpp synthase/HD superfamily hydrolase